MLGAHAAAAGAGDQLRLQGRRLGRAAACARASAWRGPRRPALQLQFGGAVGTLASLGDKGPAVARRLGRAARPARARRRVARPARRLGRARLRASRVLCGSLGKIGRDLALLAQGEVGEVAEPTGAGRGGSSAMPHKRNPVAAMVAIAAATRAPHHAAALLAAMAHEHERGLGELAGRARRVAGAVPGDARRAGRARRRRAPAWTSTRRACAPTSSASAAPCSPRPRPRCSRRRSARPRRTSCWPRLSARAIAEGADLRALLRAEPALAAVDAAALDAAFDVDAAARRAGDVATAQLDRLRRSASLHTETVR